MLSQMSQCNFIGPKNVFFANFPLSDCKVNQTFFKDLSNQSRTLSQLKTMQQQDLDIVHFYSSVMWKTQTYTLKESVWSLGGETGLVLATQNPVGKRELDLGILLSREKTLKPLDSSLNNSQLRLHQCAFDKINSFEHANSRGTAW